MRKPSVTTEEIIEAGEFLEKQKITVNGYTLKKKIGKGRPERLIDVWENRLTNGDFSQSDQSKGLLTGDIHVLEPEVELLLEDLVENMSRQLKVIVIGCDNKVQLMADKKVEVARKEFDFEMEKLYSVLDVREEFIGELQIENEKLNGELKQLKPIEVNQFENDKKFIKLRIRLESKSDLLTERQFRIDELIKLNLVLQENRITAE
jgi:hypothetical protein